MFINISDSKEAANKGSSSGLVHYLEKENRLTGNKFPENWFNGNRLTIDGYEVMHMIDNNVAKLGKADAKFFLVNISPSQKEIAFLKEQYGDDGVKDQLKGFAVRVMDAYAQNFKRESINSHEDLIWFAKLENYRYYSYNDPEVKQCIKKRGDRKEGEQLHVQVIVSRKDVTNMIKLSPMNTSRGKNEEHSKKMGQFDRVAFKQCGETLFDKLFEFDRQMKDTMAYANAQKNGSLAERVRMETQSQKEEAADLSTCLSEDQADMELATGIHPYSATIDESFEDFINPVHIDIKDDVDDEAIHGRNRHRKRQTRTNTR
ncbi:hypothetical protein JN11_00845 [Mucilaginibacter frigoritolerans]|uniref:Molybdopterin-guanine dinucleotide biosynthesis protein MobB n=1 Tax=Mucilaginibacter frigoritolerans TaxID=652788 RepID=A0A562UD48_9SPHI|nr:DUF5712 family protein [Mucilaginibacter frigoritolerans]TWJ03307.1 hypothetical protein JN11_00845 [Mucilaginibacter frigoritolerans]